MDTEKKVTTETTVTDHEGNSSTHKEHSEKTVHTDHAGPAKESVVKEEVTVKETRKVTED